jgi:hypothetical protein
MNDKNQSPNQNACSHCCKIKFIFMSIVSISLAVIAICAIAITVSHCHREHHRKWGHECEEWGHGERMRGCRMIKHMTMMNCPMSQSMEDDMNEDEIPAHHRAENRGAK